MIFVIMYYIEIDILTGNLHVLTELLGCIECMRCRLLLLMFMVSVCQSICLAAQLCVVHSCSFCQITLASCYFRGFICM